MCERWYCVYNMCKDCALPSGEQCPEEEDDQERREYDDLGDRIFHNRQDEEMLHV